MKKLNNMVVVERKIVNGTQSKGRIDVNFQTKRQVMPIARATKLQEEDELLTQENDSVSLFKILGDAYQVLQKFNGKTISVIKTLEEIEGAENYEELENPKVLGLKSNAENSDDENFDKEDDSKENDENLEEKPKLEVVKKAGRPKVEK